MKIRTGKDLEAYLGYTLCRICHGCVAQTVRKYRGDLDHFVVPCSGIPGTIDSDVPDFSLLLSPEISPDQREMAVALIDKGKWLNTYLRYSDPDDGTIRPWAPRDYQLGPLYCTAKQLIYRFGRQCLTSDARIAMADGSVKPISAVQTDDLVKSVDIRSGLLRTNTVLDSWCVGTKDVFSIVTQEGTIRCTREHPFLVRGLQWKSIEDGLQVGDQLALPHTAKVPCTTVLKIESAGSEPTYNIEVDRDHNFIANGFVVKNSGKTELMVCGRIIHPIYTTPLTTVLVLAPMKPHINNIFDRILSLLSLSPDLDFPNKVKQPNWQLSLPNGSKVIGFCTGSLSKRDSQAIRGFTGGTIIMDELSLMNEADIGAIMPTLFSVPTHKINVTASGTPKIDPTGVYYRYSQESPRWKEFHVPATVNPNWSVLKGDLLQSGNYRSEEDPRYITEVLAEFYTGASGVFKPDDVKAAVWRAPRYGDSSMQRKGDCQYILGTDWNDPPAGAIHYVVEVYASQTDPKANVISVVDKIIVVDKDYTQRKALESLINLVLRWRPVAVGVDRGYGGRNKEDLRFIGAEALRLDPTDPRCVLAGERFFDFSGGEKLHITDPALRHKPRSVYTKDFLVTSTEELLEGAFGRLRIPAHDKLLVNQLYSFIVKRRTPEGRSVYAVKSGEDHDVSAFMFAVGAMVLTLTNIMHLAKQDMVIKSGSGLIKPVRTVPINPRVEYLVKEEEDRDHVIWGPEDMHELLSKESTVKSANMRCKRSMLRSDGGWSRRASSW